MNMRRSILGGCLALVAAAHAARAENTPRNVADQFFQTASKQGVARAVDQISEGAPVVGGKVDALAALKAHAEQALTSYGGSLGAELLEEKDLGTALKRLVYIQKLERHPLIWVFYFYRPHSEWFVSGISFNDELKLPNGP